MEVKITDFNESESYIDYDVFNLNFNQIKFLNENLSEKTSICGNILKIRVYFKDAFPFQSDVAKIKLDDFIAREEIEMNVFLSSFLDDM